MLCFLGKKVHYKRCIISIRPIVFLRHPWWGFEISPKADRSIATTILRNCIPFGLTGFMNCVISSLSTTKKICREYLCFIPNIAHLNIVQYCVICQFTENRKIGKYSAFFAVYCTRRCIDFVFFLLRFGHFAQFLDLWSTGKRSGRGPSVREARDSQNYCIYDYCHYSGFPSVIHLVFFTH